MAIQERAKDRLAMLAIVNRGMAGGSSYEELHRSLRDTAGLDQ